MDEAQAVMDALGLSCKTCGGRMELGIPHHRTRASSDDRYFSHWLQPHALDLLSCVVCTHSYYRYELERL